MINALVGFNGTPTTPAVLGSTGLALLALALVLGAAALLILWSRDGWLPRRGPRVGAKRRWQDGRSAGGRPGRVNPVGELKTAPSGDALDAYRRFLEVRDGATDLRRHTLARREEFLARLAAAPVRSSAAIDRDAYRRNLPRRQIEAGLDARVLWLLATAKSNQAERFGVGLAELYGRVPSADEDPVRVHLHLQELYHTRILADVVELFALPVRCAPPPLFTRALITGLVKLPPQWVLAVVGLGEMAGCVLFRALRDRGIGLFADEPAVAERVRVLYDEILGDEISHVGFVSAQMSASGRRVMRTLYRHFGLRLALQMPELEALFGRTELVRRFRDFHLDTMLAEAGQRAFAAATI